LPVYKYSMNLNNQTTKISKNYEENLVLLNFIGNMIANKSTYNDFILRIYLRQYFSLLKRGNIDLKFRATSNTYKWLINQKYYSRPEIIIALLLTAIKPKIRLIREAHSENNVVYLHGGLGNQLFQISELLEQKAFDGFEIIGDYSNIFEKYELICPTNYPIPYNHNLSSRISRIVYRKAINFLLRLNYFSNLKSYKVNRLMQQVEKTYRLILEKTVFKGFIIVSDNRTLMINNKNRDKRLLFIGYFQFNKNQLTDRTIDYLKRLLKHDHSIEIAEYREIAKRDLPLVVHVRAGDYRQIKNFDVVGSEYYLKAINRVNNAFNFGKIWLFSNDLMFAMNLLPSDLSGQILQVQPKPRNDFLDFQLMRLGRGFVIPNSTFSWWAALLSENAEPIVTVPRNWFRYQKNPEGLIPDNWIVI